MRQVRRGQHVCLAHPEDDVAPTSMDRATLKLAGLGKKKFPVDAHCTPHEFYDEILIQFPKLRDGGGFELLRFSEGGGKTLDVIPHPKGGYSAEHLKAVVGSAKVFIRPLQKPLDVQPETSTVSKFVNTKFIPTQVLHALHS